MCSGLDLNLSSFPTNTVQFINPFQINNEFYCTFAQLQLYVTYSLYYKCKYCVVD